MPETRRMPARRDGLQPFVGRADELTRLGQVYQAAHGGQGRLVVVTGAAGVGKTRFCEEAAARAAHAGLTVIWGRCWPGDGAPALWPWQSILDELGEPAADLLAWDGHANIADGQRFARFVAISNRLAGACAAAPTLLVIDDLHAADATAVLLTRFVAKTLHRVRLVILATSRDAAPDADASTGSLLDELEQEGTSIVLRPFTGQETQAFVAANLPGQLDANLVATMHRITDGSPLLLRRLVTVAATDPGGVSPEGMRAAIRHSIRRLGAPALRILAIGTLLGHSASVAETAIAACASPADVLHAADEGAAAGLVDLSYPDEFVYSHELIRESLNEALTTVDRVDAHARAAAALASPGGSLCVDRLTRRAYHAVQAAARSTDDARRAVAASQAAARAAVRDSAYEQAASHLATAAGLYSRGDLGDIPASLLVEQAQAVLRCGRLNEARALFERAAVSAQRHGQPTVAAEAALGLGGVWVNEHRGVLQRARISALQRQALAGLPPEETTLRLRLLTRLTTEAVHLGAPVSDALAVLAEVRDHGNARALAEALSLCHHVMLTPDRARQRLQLADELVTVSSAAGEGLHALMGLCWQTIDLFHLGDPRAVRSLADLRERAEALRCQSVLFVVSLLDVMLLIRSGSLDEAEAAAARCLTTGQKAGHADASAYYAGHVLSIRWLQARDSEVLDLGAEVANSLMVSDSDFAMLATVIRLEVHAGRLDNARATLAGLAADGLAALPMSSTWLAGMAIIVESVVALRDVELARQAYDLLLPYADVPIMPSLAVVCLGSTERSLGLAAATMGRLDAAVEHLQRAVEANLRLGNRPLTTLSKAELATALRRRGATGDRERAADLLGTAVEEGRSIGILGRVAGWEAQLARLSPCDVPRARPPLAVRPSEGRWLVSHGGRDVLVEDLVGMGYLARLVAASGQPIPALELAGHGESAGIDSSAQPVLDDRARMAYATRARELGHAVSQAREAHQFARADDLQDELDLLLEEVQRATGLRGRTRSFAGPAERARTAVRKAIKRAIAVVEAADAELGAVLKATVTTGYECCYRP